MNRTLLIALLLAFACAPLFAEVTVTSSKGTVGVVIGGKAQPVTVGMKLAEGVTVVTGANSELVLDINGNSLTLKSLTTVKINTAKLTAETSSAGVSLKGGSVQSSVKQISGLRTSFEVTTPVATSSVRGTSYTVSFGPEQGMAVEVETGTVAVASDRGGTKPVPAGLGYSQSTAAPAPLPVTAALQESAVPSMGTVFSGATETQQPVTAAAADPVMEQVLAVIDTIFNAPTHGNLVIDVTIGSNP